jgi:hypothetical protein
MREEEHHRRCLISPGFTLHAPRPESKGWVEHMEICTHCQLEITSDHRAAHVIISRDEPSQPWHHDCRVAYRNTAEYKNRPRP